MTSEKRNGTGFDFVKSIALTELESKKYTDGTVFTHCLFGALEQSIKLTKEHLTELARVCRLDFTWEELKAEYSECKSSFKKRKAQEKLEAFRTENCCFNYKGTAITFKPCYCVIDDRKVVLWKTNLDKNAVYYLYENAGAIAVKAVACVTEKNKSYTYRNDLVKANTGKIKKMMIDMLAGCNFEQFFERASTFKGFREVEVKGVLKAITL